MSKPYSIKIFLPGGDPDGLRIIEKSNWSGAGLVVPRSLFGEGRQRGELSRTGVYVLLGPPETSGLPRVYVGEGDPIRPRLEQHAAKKDFWTSGIAFTSKDENLNKAHVQYLEARLVALAMQAKRCVLDNGNVPALPSMSEADAADAEGFLARCCCASPCWGFPCFRPRRWRKHRAARCTCARRGLKRRGWRPRRGSSCARGARPQRARCRPATPM